MFRHVLQHTLFGMESTMWAVRKQRAAPGLDRVEVPVPAVRDDEVLVRVEAASICGTDLHIHNWDDWAQHRIRPPVTLGHEFAGTVVEVGPLVRNASCGDYVSAESHVTCGTCFHCRTGQAHMCEHTRVMGVDRDGAFAAYVAVPGAVLWPNNRAKLPPELATLQEPFGNAVFALGHADLAGKTVAILGCGPVGLFSIGIARASGAGRVLASDSSRFRLDLARQMGAHEIVDVSREEDEFETLLRLNEGEHLDVVFEMSGASEAIIGAFQIARNGGRVILFGIPSHPVELDIAEALIFKNLDVSAVSGRRVWATWYRTRWLLEHGVVDLRPLVTAEFGLDGYQHAFELLASGDACKVVLRPQHALVEAAA
jgi:threonine 3-dehydrogenase